MQDLSKKGNLNNTMYLNKKQLEIKIKDFF